MLQGSPRAGALVARLNFDSRAFDRMVRPVNSDVALEGIGRVFDDDADDLAGRLQMRILTARRKIHLLESSEIRVCGAGACLRS